jgi:DNA gyrase subunit A
MNLDEGQLVIAMLVAQTEQQSVLTATENGYGKRTPITEYTRHGRGTKGMIAIQTSERNGKVVAATLVESTDEIMMITTGGVLIRTRVSEIREMGRATQGVRLIKLGGKDAIAAVTQVESDPEEEHVVIDGEVLEGPVVDDVEIDEPELEDDADVEGEEGDEAEPETEE